MPKLVPILVVLILLWPSLGSAYRDLSTCPDLMPLEPPLVTTEAAQLCSGAIAGASRRYVNHALEAHAACFGRVQSGALAGDARKLCRGLVRLSNGVFDLPTDPSTRAALLGAQAKFQDTIIDRCTDAGAAALGGCAPTAAGLATCILADQREHALDVLDQEFGEVGAVTDVRALRCQRAMDRALRGYVGRVGSAHEKCLRRYADGVSGVHRADTCLGAIDGGVDVPPADEVTAARITRARSRLATQLAKSCGDPLPLDACASDPAGLARCLACTGRRETMLAAQGRHGGVADRPTMQFIDWAALANPVLQDPDLLMKNQAMVRHDGWFWIVAPNELRRTQDFLTYESIPVPGGRWFGDVSRIGDIWYQTTNGNVGGDQFEIFARTSPDLLTWSPLASITPGLFTNSTIDGALTEHGGFAFLVLKDRVQQLPYVTRSSTSSVDGVWLPPQRAVAGTLDPTQGFAEAFHFLTIDGRQRVVATGRDPEPYRCPGTVYLIYTCSHEPFIYTIPDVTTDLATWVTWRNKTHLRVPYEAWNPIMHANSGQLADWREHDGFFYLSYAGSLDGDSFGLRGHGKIGLARSRDLVHWRVPGDLRD